MESPGELEQHATTSEQSCTSQQWAVSMLYNTTSLPMDYWQNSTQTSALDWSQLNLRWSFPAHYPPTTTAIAIRPLLVLVALQSTQQPMPTRLITTTNDIPTTARHPSPESTPNPSLQARLSRVLHPPREHLHHPQHPHLLAPPLRPSDRLLHPALPAPPRLMSVRLRRHHRLG